MEKEQKDRKHSVNTDQGWRDSVKKARVPLLWGAYVIYVIIILVIAGCLAYLYWECLLGDAGLARKFIFVVAAFFVVAAVIGLPLAIWRRSKVENRIRRALEFTEDHLGSLTVTTLAGFTLFSILYWNWLHDKESGSTTVRNLGLIIAAIVGLPLVIWRSKVAQQQSETAQRSLLNERYQKGTEMLGSEKLSARLGGIYALERLAREHAEDYHVLIIELFCAFVRNPPKDEHYAPSDKPPQEERPKIREDVQAIMTALDRMRNEK